MRYIKKTIVAITTILSLCISTFDSNAFADMVRSYNFNHIGVNDGFSQGTVETLLEDKNSYIWIGTNDGLERYNGYDFKHYKYDKYDENTISNNYIVDIIECDKGYIWVSTINGLNRIDSVNDEVKRYKEEDGLPNNNLWELLYTTSGKLLVSSVNGLGLYDEKNDNFNRVLNKDELPSQYIYSLHEDSRGNIWIGTDNGLVKCDKNLNKLKDYSDDIKNSEVYRIYDDGDNIWISTLGNGLFKIDSNENIKNYTVDDGLPSNVVRDTLKVKSGKLWIATNFGISMFDYNNEEFINYNNTSCDANSLSNNETFCFLEDSSGLMWVGTYNMISTFNPNSSFTTYKGKHLDDTTISNNAIHGIYEDYKNETLWIGTAGGGVNVVEVDTNTNYLLTSETSNLIDNFINDITGLENKVYVGTNNGLNIFDTNSKTYYSDKTELYTEDDGLPSNKIRSLFIDDKNMLWIGTTKGLAVLNLETKKITNLNDMLKEAGVSSYFVRSIYQDSEGDYFIGCFLDDGLIKIDSKTGLIKTYKSINGDDTSISDNSIRDIVEYEKGVILIATSHGLNVLNKSSDTFTHHTEKDGLSNNTVYGILVDSRKDIWMSTNYGISKFNIEKKRFENFTVVDGLQSNEFNGKASFKNSEGLLFFGGVNGFNVIDPKKVNVYSFTPEITIDRIKIAGVDRKIGDTYNLKSNENNIEISYFTNNYLNPKSTTYYYKLEGLDKEWNVTKNNAITLVNLKPGNYSFKIKSSSQSNSMSNEVVINFKVNPPIWRSKLAILGYISIIAILIYLNRNKVKRLDNMIYQRTKELQEEMEKNELLFEKVLKLEKNKNAYFINLSHELRTPLNVLNGVNQLLEGLISNNDVIESERLKLYVDIMKRNYERLLNLINNLIDGSKLENNKYIITKREENIVSIVEESALSLKTYIEEKGIDLVIDTDTEEKFVMCDKMEIERCIVNLVENAMKFTSSGGKIEVLIKDLNDKIEIRVKDTGIGISKENQEYIFDRFNQVVDAESESKEGSGLGLNIVKQLIELHDGTISLESELGKGSEFIITLPAI